MPPKKLEKKKSNLKPSEGLLETLRSRFLAHPHRHPGLEWAKVEARLSARVLSIVSNMEDTGGAPDLVLLDDERTFYFVDCSEQSPIGRRSLCFDKEGWLSRKEARPRGNVIDTAKDMGVELLSAEEYQTLQKLEVLDTTTSSWVATPNSIRSEGGALFGDRRYHHVFIYHNGAQSYYAARGFRAKLKI